MDEGQAAWFTRGWPRWLLVLGALWAGCLATTELFIAFTAALGRARLTESRARTRAQMLAASSLPDEGDAAPIWQQAEAHEKRWSPDETNWRDPLDSPPQDWGSEATYAADGPLRRLLAANAPALALADQAADLPHAHFSWADAREDPYGVSGPRLHLGDLGRLNVARAAVAAHDNDWATVERSLRTLAGAGRHAGQVSLLGGYAYSLWRDRGFLSSLDRALNAPRARPTPEVLRRLQRMARERLRKSPSLAEALEGQKPLALARKDALAAYGPRALRGCDLGPMPTYVEVPEWYALSYFLDRGRLEGGADKLIAEVRAFESGTASLPVETVRFMSGILDYDSISFVLPRMKGSMAGVVARRRAVWHVALASLAALEYRITNEGKWPKTLADTGLPADELRDPFSPDGSALSYRVETDGSVTIRSVEVFPSRIGDIILRLPAPEPTESGQPQEGNVAP